MSKLFDEILEAHGGLARWKQVTYIDVRMKVAGELWPRRKQDGILEQAHIRVQTQAEESTYFGFTDEHLTGSFSKDRVAIARSNGSVVVERVNPEDSFKAQDMQQPWDALHVLFANGFGVWTETMLPFLYAMPGASVEDVPPIVDETGTLMGVKASLPSSLITHKDQIIYVGEDRLIRRLDYTPGVGGVMRSTLFFDKYDEFDGLKFPTRRWMVPLDEQGKPKTDPVLLKENDISYQLQ